MTIRISEREVPPRVDGRVFAVLFAALFTVAAIPILMCGMLPLFDYPNHLARMHILASLPQSESLQQFYAVRWQPLPNLAMDAIVPLLSILMPLAWAAKVFVLATLLLLAGGAATLGRVLFGSWSAWSCLAFLLLYSRIFLWGFLNYLFGIGLMLFAFALWIGCREWHWRLRLMLGSVAATAVFFAHLLAFGLCGVLVIGFELGRVLRQRPRMPRALVDLVAALACFVPGLLILFFATPGAAAGGVSLSRFARKFDLLFSVFDNYNRITDIACFALFVVGLLCAFVFRWVRLHPDMRLPLASLLATYLVMPSQLATASGADHRIPLVLGLMLLAGSQWTAGGGRTTRIFLGAALLLFVVRMGIVAVNWSESDHVYSTLTPAFDRIPLGSRVAVAYPPEATNSQKTPLTHFPTMAIVRRNAFVPTLFAFPTQQPVALREPYREIADRLPPERLWAACVTKEKPLDEAEQQLLNSYEFINLVNRYAFSLEASPGVEPIVVEPRFVLARISGMGACTKPRVP